MIAMTQESTDKDDWHSNITSVAGEVVDVTVYPPPNCAVGKWKFTFQTYTLNSQGEANLQSIHNEQRTLYILFNAWCKGRFDVFNFHTAASHGKKNIVSTKY